MIRWEEDFEDEFGRDLTGYLGKAEIAAIVGDRFCGEYYLTFVRDRNRRYLSLSSAKRGAERMLAKFLKDANLEVIGNIFEGDGGE